MDEQPKAKKSLYARLIIALVLALFVGMAIGYGIGRRQGFLLGTALGHQVALGILPSTPVYKTIPLLPDEIYSVAGTIQAIEGNKIVFESASLKEPNVPGGAQVTEVRSVIVTAATKIVHVDFVAPEALAIESGESFPGSSNLKAILDDLFPRPVESPITFADLRVGDSIIVTAAENLISIYDFAATKIQRTD
jgi:hypothetical protein